MNGNSFRELFQDLRVEPKKSLIFKCKNWFARCAICRLFTKCPFLFENFQKIFVAVIQIFTLVFIYRGCFEKIKNIIS